MREAVSRAHVYEPMHFCTESSYETSQLVQQSLYPYPVTLSVQLNCFPASTDLHVVEFVPKYITSRFSHNEAPHRQVRGTKTKNK